MENYKKGFGFPNQRYVKVNKKECSQKELYAKINIEAMNNAMRNLKPNAYKLWCYFAKNQDNYELWLSQLDVHEVTGMSESTYHRAFDELANKQYLIPANSSGRYYKFYEIPQVQEQDFN